MNVQDKRKLLEAIDILVKRPHQSNEETLAHAMVYFKLLIDELTQDKVNVIYQVEGLSQ